MAKRKPRKKGQHRNSPSHSDLYTDENPKGTIKGLKFATVKDAEASVRKIKRSSRSHNHKTQAAIAMEQRAKAAGKKSSAAVYRRFIEQQKKKTAAKNEAIATKKNLYLDRPSASRGYISGDDKTWTGQEVSDHIYTYLRDMGLVENKEKILRKFVRSVLLESTRFNQMTKDEITGLRAYLQTANFMNVDAGGDYEDGDTFVSEAQQTLIDELSDYFGETFPPYGTVNVIVRVDLMLTLPSDGADKAIKGASYFYDGLHNIDLVIAQMDDGETLSQLGDVARKVYEVVSHELLHMHQFIKFSKGEPTIEKWNEFKRSYEETDVASNERDYFFFDPADGPSELETFSHQIANELLGRVGKVESLDLLANLKLKMKRMPKGSGVTKLDEFISLLTNSPSVKNMASRGVDFLRPEFYEMISRARQYIKKSR